MENAVVPHSVLVDLIRDMLDGEDLSKLTQRIVRTRVVRSLSDRPNPPSDAQLKPLVNAALNEVMGRSEADTKPNKSSAPAQPAKSAAKTSRTASASARGTRKGAARNTTHAEDKEAPHDFAAEADVEDDFIPRRKSDSRVQKGSRKRSRPIPVSDDDDDDDDADSGVNEADLKAGKNGVREADNCSQDEEDDHIDDASGYNAQSSRAPQPALKARAKKKTAKQTSKRVPGNTRPQTWSEKKYAKLCSVVRALGLHAPISKFRGKSVDEKSQVIIEFLRSKGVHSSDPEDLTRHEISRHRARLEKEKDMQGIDTR